jgi:hypothetical protein
MTETQYLSGRGKDDPVQWQFQCDKGHNANKWSIIGVPSNWQLQGFGIYEYGRPAPVSGWPSVHGVYKRTFTTPANWKDKEIFVAFEGVMTDTKVSINGQVAGPIHQGGYYAFRYDITKLLKPAGSVNEIQVDVDDESSNESVNHAERRGDYWNYAGIFRPVYLEAVPRAFVDHVAIQATAAGLVSADIALSDARSQPVNSSGATSVEMRVLDRGGKPVAAPVSAKVTAGNQTVHVEQTLVHPLLWSAETPNLYQMEIRLKSGGSVTHIVRQRFGFRTIELIPGRGLFVNGSRVFLKGVARHSFWPDSGRTLSEQVSKDDINLIKELNGNAVRSSHYPPDRHFLDACDELGLYVLDELSGWQANYDTEIGRKLVKEMVQHDVNHPSILFWDNGNEGGFNTDLDGEFAKYDPEKRTVLHPWAAYPEGVADTKHYPNYELLQQKLAANPVFFPTEMLHGLYDGGGGAGMSDYWDAILKSNAGAGGFIWSFVDEDVKRVDKGGILDSAGNLAPDGIVGPYREKETSFYAVRQIWSPIVVARSSGETERFTVTNRYAFLNISQSTFLWELIAFPHPEDKTSGSVVLASRLDRGPSLEPGKSMVLDHWTPPGESAKHATADALRLIIHDATGRPIQTYVWSLETQRQEHFRTNSARNVAAPVVTEESETLTATAGELSLRFSKRSGLLLSASRQGRTFAVSNGPRVIAVSPQPKPVNKQDTPPPASFAPDSRLISITHSVRGEEAVLTATFDGPMKSVVYHVRPDGWLSIEYVYSLTGAHEYFGVGFDCSDAAVKGMRFLGEGPGPVYQNRLAGGTLGVWNRAFNETIVGDPENLKPGQHFDYPAFKGFYSGVRWLQLNTSDGPVTAVLDQHRGATTYLQVLTPRTPPAKLAGMTAVPFPPTGLSFLQAIPAIGSKFSTPQATGPMGQPAVAKGEYSGHVEFYFGPLPAR